MIFSKKFSFQTLLLLGLVLGTTGCQTNSKTAKSNDFKIDYEKYTLGNGLDVILHQDDSDPIVSVAILFNVGSNREKTGRTGFAHFFEHMLFQNSENVGKGKFFTTIEDLGGTFNGGTWQDGTVYFEVVPKDALERILWMESDRMGFMINTVTEAVLENEKEVVKNEKRQRVDNQPYGHTSYVVDKALYPENHPYNWQVIGSLQDLEAATLEDVKEFYQKWYGPNNATMVIAGDFNKEEVKSWVEKYFGEIPARSDVEPIQPMAGKLDTSVLLFHEDNFAQLPELTMTWPTVDDNHPDRFALDYLGQLLSIGKRAPLYKEIVENRKLAPTATAYNSTGEIAGKFNIRVRANADIDLDTIYDAINKGLQDFEKNGINDKDMERIKNLLETDFYNGLSSILSKSFQLVQYNEFKGSPDVLEEEINQILSVTKTDIQRVYEEYIKDKPFVLTSFVPKGKMDLAVTGCKMAAVEEEPIVQGAEPEPLKEEESGFEKTPSKIDRSVIPPLGEAPIVKNPVIWTNKLSNGMTIYGIENAELPIVQFSLILKGGILVDEPSKIGISNLVTSSMMEGTANKTPEELEDAIGQLGAEINMSLAPEYITLSVNCLSRNFEQVVALVEEILLEPRWDEKEFELIKQNSITSLKQREAVPSFISSKVFTRLIYGTGNTLAEYSGGTVEINQAATIDDLKSYYDRNFSPSVATMHFSGNIDQERVKKALAGIEEKWKAKEVLIPEVKVAKPVEKPIVYFVDVPNAKQSVIRIGGVSLKGGDPDFSLASMMNERLGGGTSSRLFQQLREEKGYTYGAYSSFSRRVHEGSFAASSSVRSNVTLESALLFKEILSNYNTSFSEEDLEKAKSSILKGNARQYETLRNKISILESISLYELPMDFIQKDQEAILNVNLDQAKSLISKYINPGQMIYLVVGDKATQLERLKELGYGDPVLLDKDGMPASNVLN